MIRIMRTISSSFRIKSSNFHTSNHPPLKLNLSNLHYAFDSIHNIDDALALFHCMLQMNPHPSVSHYNKLFQTILKMEHYTHVHVILMFKKMTLLAKPVNDYTMNILINCYSNLEVVDMSFMVIAAFVKRGFAPDVVTFNCLIKGLFINGKLDEAVGLFKNLMKGKWCEVDEVTVSTVLNGLSKSGNVGEAVELLKVMEEKNFEVDVFCYTAVVDGLCKGGRLKDGMELLFRMVDKGVIPDVVSYTCLLHGLCMNRKVEFACGIFDDLTSKGVYLDVIVYTVMIQGLCRKGLFREAKELVAKMERAGCFPDDVTYRVIIQGCLHHCENYDSINLLKEIVGREFQLDAPSFFLLLRQIQVLRQMKGVYDDEVVNQLIEKLLSSSAIHQLRDPDDEFMISSLVHKLSSSDSRYSLS